MKAQKGRRGVALLRPNLDANGEEYMELVVPQYV
jgi:hypothetical protein